LLLGPDLEAAVIGRFTDDLVGPVVVGLNGEVPLLTEVLNVFEAAIIEIDGAFVDITVVSDMGVGIPENESLRFSFRPGTV
jgi:hypothetical protein